MVCVPVDDVSDDDVDSDGGVEIVFESEVVDSKDFAVEEEASNGGRGRLPS